jgi:DNA-binding NarL/FixJ family response regulator
VTARVLVLTTYESDRDVLAAIEAGATGYLLKDASQEELFRAVEASVKAHLLHIYAKLGVNDRAAAVAAAYDRGLLTPGGR